MRNLTIIPILLVACLPESQIDPTQPLEHQHAGDAEQTDGLFDELGESETVPEGPISTLSVHGSEFQFFAWEDGSAGVLEAGNGQLTGSLEDVLESSSVAEVFWALSEKGTPIPELLTRHHEAMALDWGASLDPRAGEQGWLARRPLQIAGTNYCANATFNSNICGSGTYPDGPGCFNNVTGSVGWNTGGTRRYRAGVCVQDGEANDYLRYQHYTDSSTCNTTCGASHTVWGYSWNTYSSPHSDIYLNWWWIAPSSAARRTWSHSGSNHSGAVYDWGTKTLDVSDCRY